MDDGYQHLHPLDVKYPHCTGGCLMATGERGKGLRLESLVLLVLDFETSPCSSHFLNISFERGSYGSATINQLIFVQEQLGVS